jgi:ABC-2 type transport system permease protein
MNQTFTYLRYEVLRTMRNRRFVVFALGFPVVLYFLIAGPNKNETDLAGTGISAPLYFMVGLASFGTMTSMLSTGGRIANERAAGWTRQLRISPLAPRAYFRTKVATGYLMALLTLAVLYACGLSLGVSMPASDWLEVTGLILVALVPFAALGIVAGHLMNPDSIGPVIGGATALFAFLGGTWFPVPDTGFLHDVALEMPSYWLVQASRIAVGGEGWDATAWIVIAAWTAVLSVLAVWIYRRDTGRI